MSLFEMTMLDSKDLAKLFMDEAHVHNERAKRLVSQIDDRNPLKDHTKAIESMARVVVADALSSIAIKLKEM